MFTVEQPDDPRFWHELPEADRMKYRTKGAEFLAQQRKIDQ